MRNWAFSLMALAGLAGSAAGQVHFSDILLKVENGRIVTGEGDEKKTHFPAHVFLSELGELIPNASTEPGFDSEAGVFAPGTVVGLTVRRALREWNGSDFSTLAAAPLRITKNANSVTTPAADPSPCEGASLALGAATSSGRFHQHAGFELLAPASPGVYLLEFDLWFGEPGSGGSDPVYIVFNQEQALLVFEEAAEYAEQALSCYANCDGSTVAPVLNVADFSCFLQRFAAGDCRANCDRSVLPPVLNVADFTCFLQKYAAGCPVE
jgi:hypothetical protein